MKQTIEYSDQTKQERAELEPYHKEYIERDPYNAFSTVIDTLNDRIEYLGKIIHGIPAGYYNFELVTGYEAIDLSFDDLIKRKEALAEAIEVAVVPFELGVGTPEDEEDLKNKVDEYINIVSALFVEIITIVSNKEDKINLDPFEGLVWDLEKVRDMIGRKQAKLPYVKQSKFSAN